MIPDACQHPCVRFASLSDLAPQAGQEIAVSAWIPVDQATVDAFAAATGDRNWIHVDAERAARESPFGGTIAHGFLILSLMAAPLQACIRVESVSLEVNGGLNKVRFLAPVLAGTRIRCRLLLSALTPIPGGAQLTWTITVEREAEDKPACVAEVLIRLYEDPPQ